MKIFKKTFIGVVVVFGAGCLGSSGGTPCESDADCDEEPFMSCSVGAQLCVLRNDCPDGVCIRVDWNESAADVDLHVTPTQGELCSASDCREGECNSAWGTEGADDDPVFESGPTFEEVRVSSLAAEDYDIYVHAVSGATASTVRVIIDGGAVTERGNELFAGDMIYSGKLIGPNGLLSTCELASTENWDCGVEPARCP